MNILFVAYGIGNAGAMSNIELLLRAYALEHPEDRICIVCSQNSWLKRLQDCSNVSYYVFQSDIMKEVRRMYLVWFKIPRIVEKSDIDLVWAINFGSCRRLNVPQVLGNHNPYNVYPWSIRRYHPKSAAHLAVLRWLFRRALSQSQAVIVQTELMKQYVLQLARLGARVLVAPKAVEREDEVGSKELPEDILSLLESNAEPRRFTFLYVATFVPHKNHEVLVEAISKLVEMGVASRVILTVKAEDLKRSHFKLGDELISSGRIVPLGWVSKEHLRGLYDACDACVMPSVLESLSSSHLEAMHWGKPQVSADLPYAHDLCGDASLYAGANDSSDWAQKMRLIIDDASLRERLVEAGYQRVGDFPHSWSEVARRIRGFFQAVVDEELRMGRKSKWRLKRQSRLRKKSLEPSLMFRRQTNLDKKC